MASADPNLLPRRIVKETQRLLSEPAPGINATPYKDNLRYFNVIMAGPSQSAYESASDTVGGVCRDSSICLTPLRAASMQQMPLEMSLVTSLRSGGMWTRSRWRTSQVGFSS